MHQVVTNILVYALLGLLSLVHVFRMFKRGFDVSVFYQLAFALEKGWHVYQCNFVAWILVIFNFLLVHNGACLAQVDRGCGAVRLSCEIGYCLV